MRRFKKRGKHQVAEQPSSVSRGRCYFYTGKVAAVDSVANSYESRVPAPEGDATFISPGLEALGSPSGLRSNSASSERTPHEPCSSGCTVLFCTAHAKAVITRARFDLLTIPLFALDRKLAEGGAEPASVCHCTSPVHGCRGSGPIFAE